MGSNDRVSIKVHTHSSLRLRGVAGWLATICQLVIKSLLHAVPHFNCVYFTPSALSLLSPHLPFPPLSSPLLSFPAVHTPLPEPIPKSPVADDVKCYSDYEPRGIREASLKAAVISGLARDGPGAGAGAGAGAGTGTGTGTGTGSGTGWKSVIYENLVHENLVKSAIKAGYKDFKHLLYAEGKDSGALNILIQPQKAGSVFVCETPGIWGALPEGFEHLWDAKPTMHLTVNVPNDKAEIQRFAFSADKAKLLEYEHTKDLEICMEIKGVVAAGSHVLTIAPTTAAKIILAWIIVP